MRDKGNPQLPPQARYSFPAKSYACNLRGAMQLWPLRGIQLLPSQGSSIPAWLQKGCYLLSGRYWSSSQLKSCGQKEPCTRLHSCLHAAACLGRPEFDSCPCPDTEPCQCDEQCFRCCQAMCRFTAQIEADAPVRVQQTWATVPVASVPPSPPQLFQGRTRKGRYRRTRPQRYAPEAANSRGQPTPTTKRENPKPID